MIDFSCCEVNKAVKDLYSDNEVISIKPILKPINDSFANKLETVYYGKFSNPKDGQLVLYNGNEVGQADYILFNKVINPAYDFFQGYEVTLKNALLESSLIINFVPHESYGPSVDGHLLMLYNSPYMESFEMISNGYKMPFDFAKAGFSLIDEVHETIFLGLNGADPIKELNIVPADFLYDGNVWKIEVMLYDVD
ncbi:hypothetical protein [Flagellimonas aequoris]|uniref:Uncharacterized protein n=1 Tax=Flagellimonas aequoris TaxID=2306997 RepID=A0A418N4G8_9FLAO|nr:hypothetical protein [Allomuricauda aequoris]RIV68706.1 hypothetical protein D2U88_16080 [Allomuricauda aequoris]TXK00405.1 hypothetical protein FQ019_15900 [Allomuricauda aequoris]